MLSKKMAMLIAIFLFFIPISYALGFVNPPEHFDVLPNKTYSTDFCVVEDTNGATILELSNNSGLIENFSYDEYHPYIFDGVGFIGTRPEIVCSTMYIKIADYKTINEELIVEDLVISLNTDSGLNLAFSTPITFDASEVSYINVLLKFSAKLVITILSIFAMLTVLLYMIRKIRKE